MAIIYTYPKLTDPQGNELIVVSDVNNRNATRLITIASIASLVPSGGGCGTAINGIITGAGDYIAPLCNDVTFVGSGVDISADQATATVTFTVPPYVLPCASLSTIGGIKVGAVDTEVDPTLGQSDTNIMVEVNTSCQAYVPIPATVITCADATTIGGVKAVENTTITVMPEVAEEGSYYPIEVVKAQGAASQDECRTIVKIPTGQGEGCEDVFKTVKNFDDSFTFDANGCNDTLALGSTGGTVTITSLAQGSVNFEVDTEIDCATTAVIGGVKVATDNTGIDPLLDVQGVAYPLEVNTACEAFVRVPTSGGGGGEQAWSPLSIYEGTQAINNDVGIMVQSVAEATITGMNKVDFFIMNLPASSAGDVGRFDIYVGSIQSGGTWLGGGVSSGSGVAGVETITLQEPINIIAGNKYVIYWRLVGDIFAALGTDVGIVVDVNLAVGTGVPGGSGIPDADLGTEIAALQMTADEPEAKFRIAHTMYKA